MSKTPISTRPADSGETVLRDKFVESIVRQSEQMDKLAPQLITLAQRMESEATTD